MYHFIAFLASAYFVWGNPVFAHDLRLMTKNMMEHAHDPEGRGNTLALTLIPQGDLKIGKTTKIRLRITALHDGAPVTKNELKVVHEHLVHLLAIDPSLTDYHHIHPTPTNTSGEWVFDFTPRKEAPYRIWVDVMPTATAKQEYIKADIGNYPFTLQDVDESQKTTAHINGYTFSLYFDEPLVSGKEAMGKIVVKDKNQQPVTHLEPIMGAFAHIVGFSAGGNSILHAHPMGKEPSKTSARGGPELQFHMGPQQPGFVKLFIQTRINKEEQIIPFAIHIPQ